MRFFRRLSPGGRRYLLIGLVVVLIAGSFNAGMLLERYQWEWGPKRPQAAASNVPPELQAEFENFVQIYQLVGREYYYGTPDGRKLDYGASRGLLSTLGDDYTVFLEPVQQQGVREQMSGDYEGVGIYLEGVSGRWIISSPIKEAPADKAGLHPRDEIVRIDGREIFGLKQEEVQQLLRGKAGTVVNVGIKRPATGETLEVAITRAVINIPSVQLQLLDGGIALIGVTIFGDKTTAQFDEALREAKAAKVRGIIVDLRNNGGGWVEAAQQMIGRFVEPSRGPALIEDKENGAQAKLLLNTPTPMPTAGPGTPTAVVPTSTYAILNTANPKRDPILAPEGVPTVYDLPLVVLVNGGTASASEIVVGALQDYGRVTLIGTTTFGKGSIQAVHEFKDGSSARITIAQWLTPKGRVIHKHGLQPDLVVEQPQGNDDAPLQRALAFLREGR